MKTTTTWISEMIKWVKEHPDFKDPESIYQQIDEILDRAQSLEQTTIILAFVEGQSDILRNGAKSATLGVDYYNEKYK